MDARSLVAYTLGRVHLRAGRLDEARSAIEQAIAEHARMQNDHGLANCYDLLGEVDRAAGAPEAALRAYERAQHMWETIRSGEAVVPRLNRSLALIELGRCDQADAELDAIAPVIPERRWVLRLTMLAARLCCDLHAARHREAAGRLDELEALDNAHEVEDVGRLAALAADLPRVPADLAARRRALAGQQGSGSASAQR